MTTNTVSPYKAGDIVEFCRRYDYITDAFIEGPEPYYAGTTWRILQVTNDYVSAVLVSGKYPTGWKEIEYKYPGHKVKFESSDGYQGNHPGRPLNEEILREIRKA